MAQHDGSSGCSRRLPQPGASSPSLLPPSRQALPHIPAQVDSPVLVQNASRFIMNPSFFALAHFAKFVPRGAVRSSTRPALLVPSSVRRVGSCAVRTRIG